MNEYQKQAEDFLKKNVILFRITAVGRKNWNGAYVNTYYAMFEKGDKTLGVVFHDSIANTKYLKSEKPGAYDVLACITKSDPGEIWDFFADYGYEANKESAAVYRDVKKEWEEVSGFFTPEEIEQLQEIS